MASSSSMSSRRSSEPEFGTPMCRCGELASMKHSWTGRNPGRRFFGCPNYGKNGACGYFRWIDEPIPEHAKHIISGLLRRVEQKEGERDEARRRSNVLSVERDKARRRSKVLFVILLAIVLLNLSKLFAP